MVTRYHIALLFKQHWQLLSWKGDDKTNGIYFDEKYGYLVERTYAVRVQHDEPAPPVFYIPTEMEDEVRADYPFTNLTKRPNKYQFLFSEKELPKEKIPDLFFSEGDFFANVEIKPLKEFLLTIAKKRERDRTWLVLKKSNAVIEVFLTQKEKEGYEVLSRMEKEFQCQKTEDSYIIVNANTLLHALNLFSSVSSVSFSKLHDRIIVTSEASIPKVEALIALPKGAISKEIELSVST